MNTESAREYLSEQLKRQRRKLAGADGAVIVIVALLLIIVISFGALAIDGLTAANAQRQLTVVSEMGSLAAAEQFFGSGAATTQGQLTEALARANQVSALNALVGYAEGEAGTEDQPFGYLGLAFGFDPGNDCSAWPAGNDCTNGSLIPGEYFLEDPDEAGPEDPCVGDYPCFLPAPDETGTINAFQVVTNFVTPMRTWFGGLTGFDNLSMTGSAVAAQVPRHAMFLVDESPSIAGDTHRSSNLPCTGDGNDPNPPLDSACYLHFAGFPGGAAAHTYDWTGPPADPDVDLRVRAHRSFYAYEDIYTGGSSCVEYYAGDPNTNPVTVECSWEALVAFGNRPGACPPGGPADPTCPWQTTSFEDFEQTKWFPDDYSYNFSVDDQCDRGSGSPAGTRNYRAPDPLGPLPDPQPLFSILRGVVAALNEFANNAVAGDLIGVKAFDQCVPDDPVSGRFFDLGPVSNIPTTAVDPDHASRAYLDNMFFPMGPYNTDGVLALEQAVSDLSNAPNALLASSFVVIFTDWLFNCEHSGGTANCQNLYPEHALAMGEAATLADLFASQRVAAHVIFAGEAVFPHTLLYRSLDQNDCMDDLEARYLGIDFVRPGCSDPVACNNNFNQMLNGIGTYSGHILNAYDFARKTGGEFVTLRDPCVQGSDVTPALTAACQAAPAWSWTVPPVPTEVYQPPYTQGSNPGENEVICEPTGVSKDVQVQNAIARIMGVHPFKLMQ